MAVAVVFIGFCFISLNPTSGFLINEALENVFKTFGAQAAKEPIERFDFVVPSGSGFLFKRDPACLMQIPGTGLFRGYTLPFYTFDSNAGKCRLVLGVTVRQTAPNVFQSMKKCRAVCCLNRSC
ncbi:hypothetical protein L596_010191 [Steinernema carpocapsae]|uniref:Uncharacterized protein n=1 Tax=Steinernema carpocapsae TaxID=34508 RepID=A0A4U5PHU1_STECR|nr:hypothetical protein L596_010191 [Steinernema carpocapsae]